MVTFREAALSQLQTGKSDRSNNKWKVPRECVFIFWVGNDLGCWLIPLLFPRFVQWLTLTLEHSETNTFISQPDEQVCGHATPAWVTRSSGCLVGNRDLNCRECVVGWPWLPRVALLGSLRWLRPPSTSTVQLRGSAPPRARCQRLWAAFQPEGRTGKLVNQTVPHLLATGISSPARV